MALTYRDKMKCPKGHIRTIIRRIGTARQAIVDGRRIKSYCCDCQRSYWTTPNPPPSDQ